MRIRAATLACVTAVLVGAGCGGQSDETPVACLDGPGAYLGALGDAPGGVRLSGEVSISDCLAENQTGADLATAGAAMIEATMTLNSRARAERGGDAGLQLGYLVGAARTGAAQTGGIHSDLLRRLTAAALYSPGSTPLSRGFLSAYRRGLDTGQARG